MLDVSGAQLFTLEVGDGPDVAVMLHGGPGASHDYLRPGLDALAAPGRRRALLLRSARQRPLAARRRQSRPAPWQQHVADLDAVRVHLGGAPMTLVGYSWGALLAMLYAIEHRARVARLVLVSPAPAAARERRRGQGAPRRDERAAIRWRRCARASTRPIGATASRSPSPATSPIPRARSG